MEDLMYVIEAFSDVAHLARELRGAAAVSLGLIATVVGLVKAFFGLKLFKLQFMGFAGTIFMVLFLLLTGILGVDSLGVGIFITLLGLVLGCYLGCKFYKTGMYFYAGIMGGTVFAALTLKGGFGLAVLAFIFGVIAGLVLVKKYGDHYIIIASAISGYKPWLSVGILLLLAKTDFSERDFVTKVLALALALIGAYWQLKKRKEKAIEAVDEVETDVADNTAETADNQEVLGAAKENATEKEAIVKKEAIDKFVHHASEKAKDFGNKVRETYETKVLPTMKEYFEKAKQFTIEKVAEFKCKWNEDKRFKTICIAAISGVFVVIIGVTMYANNPLNKFKEAYEDGDQYAAKFSYDDMNQSQKRRAEDYIMVSCQEAVDYFNQGEISYDKAEQYLAYTGYTVRNESEELKGLLEKLIELKHSKDAYEAAGEDLEILKSEDENSESCTEMYRRIIEELSTVVEYDTNYENVQRLVTDASAVYADNMVNIAKQILHSDDYEMASAVIEKALEELPNNDNLLASKESVAEEIAKRKEREQAERELASLKRLKKELDDHLSNEILSPIAPRTMLSTEFISANLFTIGEEKQWGLLICDDSKSKLYVDNGERTSFVLDQSGAVSYSTSSDGSLMIRFTNENTYSGYHNSKTRYITRKYYTITKAGEFTTEYFVYKKVTQGDEVTRNYLVESREVSEHEFNQREELYTENTWTDITVVKDEDRFEVVVNTAEAVAAVQAEFDALIAERMN